MPRKARIDVASALHHIICRGIERREIFKDNIDRGNFVDRLGKILSEKNSVFCLGIDIESLPPVADNRKSTYFNDNEAAFNRICAQF